MLDPKLIELLQCPDCGGKIIYSPKPERLRCAKCHRILKIQNGIPVMLPSSSNPPAASRIPRPSMGGDEAPLPPNRRE
ncbi:MAG: hypothetical protein HYS86_04550 [Candidatus Chisholmbacteria bacterium]|nr:hypothetical protein [Candidatus Chisholmbacteria bacterium]